MSNISCSQPRINKDTLGTALSYPFLQGDWEIHTWRPGYGDPSITDEYQTPWVEDDPHVRWKKEDKLGDFMVRGTDTEARLAGRRKPTLRWVKDTKVVDLYMKNTGVTQFLETTGLSLHMNKGAFVLSKRISRIMRPYRYWNFFQPAEITIDHNPALDPAVWDGAGQISRQLVQRMADNLDPNHPNYNLYMKELNGNRFEITVMHTDGQEKGHVYVVDGLAVDLMFPAGSAKTEVRLTGRVFVGIAPVHGNEHMRLDVQSLINLYPFFKPEHLLAWTQEESEMFYQGIRTGEVEQLLSRINNIKSSDDLIKLKKWFLGEYLVSGGSLMWFPGTVKAMARQHLLRLYAGQRKLRLPIPGGRFYVLPDDVGGRTVQPGHIELEDATAWVNANDWKEFILESLGGADGDDGLWVFPFTDYDRVKKILAWRSPNQLGEYVLLEPTANSLEINNYPRMNSRDLPPQILTINYEYERLETFPEVKHPEYSMAAMDAAITQVEVNSGTLGAYCNMLMLCKALYGRLPTTLPARLEDVIDGSVKESLDLSPVMHWIHNAAKQIVKSGKPIPHKLYPRIAASLTRKERDQIIYTERHWVDTLVAAIENHKDTYIANIDALALETKPPVEIFIQHGRHWTEPGQALNKIYATGIRQRTDQEIIAEQCEAFLESWGANQARDIMLGAACAILQDQKRSDAVLWQHKSTLPQTFLSALRMIGIIGEPVWTSIGATLWYEEPIKTAVPIQLNGVWFNWLLAQGHKFTEMRQVNRELRATAKARIATMADNLTGMILETAVAGDNRLVTYTPNGNLFGYVKRNQELRAAVNKTWQIIHATETDGNILAVMV